MMLMTLRLLCPMRWESDNNAPADIVAQFARLTGDVFPIGRRTGYNLVTRRGKANFRRVNFLQALQRARCHD